MHSVALKPVDLDRLKQIARAMARTLPPSLVVGLVGTLGAGKTTLTQAIAAACGVDPEDVTSPTFTLLCSYQADIASGPITLHHLDAYRVGDEDEFLELGVEELFDTPNAWVVIEWADRFESLLPPDALWIHIDTLPADTLPADSTAPNTAITSPDRILKFETRSDRLGPLLDQLIEALDQPDAS